MDTPSQRHDTLAVVLGIVAAFVGIALAFLIGFPLAVWLLADDAELVHGVLFRIGIILLVALVVIGLVALVAWKVIGASRQRA